MGIQGLLPTLKQIISPVHIRVYAGKRAAIDTYSWLHKAAYSCAKDLCNGRPSDKFLDYCMHRVNLLRHHGVQPVLVFDGGVLPMKSEQEAKRARSRKENLERAQEHEKVGNHSGAYECYQKAVDITPALALRLIKVLQKEGVEYIVAPYEADAQMAYLALQGLVDVIITEDSDLIAYGCPVVLFKMSKGGQGDEFQFCDIQRNKEPDLGNFTKEMVLEMCVMSGCDYLPSLPGMGVKKAHRLMRTFKSYQKVIRHLRFSGTTISAQYEELFERALLTFRHQRVYDPVQQRMVHLTEVPSDLTLDLEFLGRELDQVLVKAIAEGEVDPTTSLPFLQESPKLGPAPRKFSFIQHAVAKKAAEMPAQGNLLTKYFSPEYLKAKQHFKDPRMVKCSAKQGTKDLPAKPTVGTPVPKMQDTARSVELEEVAAEVFGSPLPDDDEDDDDEYYGSPLRDDDSGLNAFQDVFGSPLPDDDDEDNNESGLNVFQVDHENVFDSRSRSVRKGGVLQGRFPLKERKKTNVDESHGKVSGYFSYPKSEVSKLAKQDLRTISTRRNETGLKDVDSCNAEVMKKTGVAFEEIVSEKVEESFSSLRPQTEVLFDDTSHMKRTCREKNVFEKWKRPSPVSKAFTEAGSSEVGKFSSNVSHVDQYAQIAQKSVDRFAAAIAPFRCPLQGSKASGLPAPMSNISVKASYRSFR